MRKLATFAVVLLLAFPALASAQTVNVDGGVAYSWTDDFEDRDQSYSLSLSVPVSLSDAFALVPSVGFGIDANAGKLYRWDSGEAVANALQETTRLSVGAQLQYTFDSPGNITVGLGPYVGVELDEVDQLDDRPVLGVAASLGASFPLSDAFDFRLGTSYGTDLGDFEALRETDAGETVSKLFNRSTLGFSAGFALNL